MQLSKTKKRLLTAGITVAVIIHIALTLLVCCMLVDAIIDLISPTPPLPEETWGCYVAENGDTLTIDANGWILSESHKEKHATVRSRTMERTSENAFEYDARGSVGDYIKIVFLTETTVEVYHYNSRYSSRVFQKVNEFP